MINVSITEDGSVKMSCTKCGRDTVVVRSWADSPFWDVFIGQAILVMLGHLVKDHDRLLSQQRTRRSSQMRLPVNVVASCSSNR